MNRLHTGYRFLFVLLALGASTATMPQTAQKEIKTSVGFAAGSSPATAGASDSHASKSGSGSAPVAQALPAPGESTMEARAGGEQKTVANGLYMVGQFTYLYSGSNVTVTLDRINNDSTFRTTGTLRLELWASVVKPARAGAFTGYRLGVSSLLNPMPPQTYYSNLGETRPFLRPPDGTYWFVLVLLEYSPGACSSTDGYCQQDSFASFGQEVFGAPPPPTPSLGVLTNTLGSRATVSSAGTMYGGFGLAGTSKVYILVRGNSLGTLGVTQRYLDAPHVRLYNAQGVDLVTQGGLVGFNFCLASNTVTDYPVVYYYQTIRGEPVDSRDSCYTATLSAGNYTFSVTPSSTGIATTNSANSSGEVLFEVSLARP